MPQYLAPSFKGGVGAVITAVAFAGHFRVIFGIVIRRPHGFNGCSEAQESSLSQEEEGRAQCLLLICYATVFEHGTQWVVYFLSFFFLSYKYI